jgi:hypothetical protein
MFNFEKLPEKTNDTSKDDSTVSSIKKNLRKGVLGLAGLLALHSTTEAQVHKDDVKPLYVMSETDPRYQAYNDSLNLWKAYQFQKTNIHSEPLVRQMAKEVGMSYEDLKAQRQKNFTQNARGALDAKKYSYDSFKYDPTQQYDPIDPSVGDQKIFDYYKTLSFHGPVILGKYSSPDIVHKNIRPVKEYFDGVATSPVYQKPEQPVFIEGTPQADAAHKQELMKGVGLYTGKIDGDWGNKSIIAWKKYEEQEQEKENVANVVQQSKKMKEENKEPLRNMFAIKETGSPDVTNTPESLSEKPKDKIVFEPHTVNLFGGKGQYVYYNNVGYATPITQKEFERLKSNGVEEIK